MVAAARHLFVMPAGPHPRSRNLALARSVAAAGAADSTTALNRRRFSTFAGAFGVLLSD
jgi:hypothetical protein